MPFTFRATLVGCLVTAIVAALAHSEQLVPQPAHARGTHPRISLNQDAATLESLLEELAEQSALKLAVGPECRWEQVSVRVRDRPAARVRADLAELLNYTWERQRGSDRVWLRAAGAAQAYEENLRRRWFGVAVDELLEYAALARRPPAHYIVMQEALAGRRPPDPRLRGFAMEVVTDPARHAGLRLLLTLSREQLLELVIAKEVGYYLPWRRMSPQQRAIAAEVGNGLGPGRKWLQAMGVSLDIHLWPGTPHPHQYYVRLANAFLPCGDAITYADGPPPAVRPGADTRGRPYPPRDSQPKRDDEVAGYQDLEQMPFPARGFRQNYPLSWPEVFAQLGERLPFALYSDYFAAVPFGQDPSYFANDPDGEDNPPPLAVEKMSVAEGLDVLCARLGKIWWREGDALFFRSRAWFLDRLYQVPPPVLAVLQHQLSARGKLDRRGVDLLAGLTSQQIDGLDLLVHEQLKRQPSWPAFTMYWPLQVYPLLTTQQKERVLRPEGLSVKEMTPAQRYRYQEALLLRGPGSSLDLVENPPPFRLTQSVIPGVPKGRPSVVQLRFFLGDQAERPGAPRRQLRVLASLQVPFPAEESRT